VEYYALVNRTRVSAFYREALETCMNEPALSHTPANSRFNQVVWMIVRQSQQQHCLYS